MKISLAALLAAIALTACSREAPPAPGAKAQAPWQTQLDALEKAKGVESQIMEADRKRRQQIEQMSQ